MGSQILNMIVQAINAANEWFMTIINTTGTATIVVGFISIVLGARFILQPIIGGRFFKAASDRVSKSIDSKE